MSASLVRLDTADTAHWPGQLVAAAVHSPVRLYIKVEGSPADSAPSPALLALLSKIYVILGRVAPMLEAIPLLATAGWTIGHTAGLMELTALLTTPPLEQKDRKLLTAINAARPCFVHPLHLDILLPPEAMPKGMDPGPEQQQPQPEPQARQKSSASTSSRPSKPPALKEALLFEHVAVGGTFDRMHAGHRLLLAATALVATKTVFVGITADALLANKRGRELIQPYAERAHAAVGFIKAVRPALTVQNSALSDPGAPTGAETQPHIQALVVSQETLAGGQAINAARVARGFDPLALVVVGLVRGRGAQKQDKLSSSVLREEELYGALPADWGFSINERAPSAPAPAPP